LGGKFTQVKGRKGTVVANVSNLAVFDSKTNKFKNIAPKLGGTDSEVWDMSNYGQDVLIAGNFSGPTSTQRNLVLVKGAGANAGRPRLLRRRCPLRTRGCPFRVCPPLRILR
jgi:hypothetical protein